MTDSERSAMQGTSGLGPQASRLPLRGQGWGATHVLAHEREGRMVEVLVRLDRQALYTAEEWTGHEVAEWTFESDGKIYYCGEDAAGMGKCTLRPLGALRLRLDDVLASVEKLSAGGGFSTSTWVRVGEVARDLGREASEVEKSLATLGRLGVVERGDLGWRKL